MGFDSVFFPQFKGGKTKMHCYSFQKGKQGSAKQQGEQGEWGCIAYIDKEVMHFEEARVLYYRLLGALLQHHHCHLYCLLMGAAYRGRVLLAQAFVSLCVIILLLLLAYTQPGKAQGAPSVPPCWPGPPSDEVSEPRKP